MTKIFSIRPFCVDEIYDVVKDFQVELPKHSIGIIKAEIITPDSVAIAFSWDKFYVLYSSDSVTNLQQVGSFIEEWFPGKIDRFIEPIKPLHHTEMVGAPRQTNQWPIFAVQDGENYAFLAEIEPNEKKLSYWAQR